MNYGFVEVWTALGCQPGLVVAVEVWLRRLGGRCSRPIGNVALWTLIKWLAMGLPDYYLA